MQSCKSDNYPGGVGDDSVRKLLAGASPLESEPEINRIQSLTCIWLLGGL